MKITSAFLFAIAPNANPLYVADIVRYQDILTKYDIVTPMDVAHFFGQMAVETTGFTKLEENLYYTTAKRLREVWPSRFKTDAAAAPYVRNPEKLANLVYGGRLGNTGPNDGWLYRGSGGFHTTGKYNYQVVEDATGIRVVASPQLLRQFPAALESAAVYWRDKKLARYVGDVKALTKAVQGGTGGLADRITYTNRALKAAGVISGTPTPAPTPTPPAVAIPVLRVGSKGDPVKELQSRLKSLGYSSVGNIDGHFGSSTEDAVQLFQRNHGLIADGIVGNATWKALINAKPADYRDPPKPLREPSGLDKFVTWLVGLFRR